MSSSPRGTRPVQVVCSECRTWKSDHWFACKSCVPVYRVCETCFMDDSSGHDPTHIFDEDDSIQRQQQTRGSETTSDDVGSGNATSAGTGSPGASTYGTYNRMRSTNSMRSMDSVASDMTSPGENYFCDDDVVRRNTSIAQSFALPANPKGEFQETKRMKKATDDVGNKIINEYSVLHELGRGAYGKVKLAIHQPTGEKTAIKIMNKTILGKARKGKESALADTMKEVAIMKRLRHPNVTHLFEVIDDPASTKIYLIMEYVEGGAIYTVGRSPKPLSTDTVRDYASDIINGLTYLHAQGIIHRDIKPENILLTPEGTCKLADFGVSSSVGDVEQSLRGTVGTPAYMAPELISGTSIPAPLVDAWAFGVTLYAIAYGVLPFRATNFAALFQEIAECDVDYDYADVDPQLRDLIMKLLHPDLQLRYSIEQAMNHSFLRDMALMKQYSFARIVVTDEETKNAVVLGRNVRLAKRVNKLMNAKKAIDSMAALSQASKLAGLAGKMKKAGGIASKLPPASVIAKAGGTGNNNNTSVNSTPKTSSSEEPRKTDSSSSLNSASPENSAWPRSHSIAMYDSVPDSALATPSEKSIDEEEEGPSEPKERQHRQEQEDSAGGRQQQGGEGEVDVAAILRRAAQEKKAQRGGQEASPSSSPRGPATGKAESSQQEASGGGGLLGVKQSMQRTADASIEELREKAAREEEARKEEERRRRAQEQENMLLLQREEETVRRQVQKECAREVDGEFELFFDEQDKITEKLKRRQDERRQQQQREQAEARRRSSVSNAGMLDASHDQQPSSDSGTKSSVLRSGNFSNEIAEFQKQQAARRPSASSDKRSSEGPATGGDNSATGTLRPGETTQSHLNPESGRKRSAGADSGTKSPLLRSGNFAAEIAEFQKQQAARRTSTGSDPKSSDGSNNARKQSVNGSHGSDVSVAQPPSPQRTLPPETHLGLGDTQRSTETSGTKSPVLRSGNFSNEIAEFQRQQAARSNSSSARASNSGQAEKVQPSPSSTPQEQQPPRSSSSNNQASSPNTTISTAVETPPPAPVAAVETRTRQQDTLSPPQASISPRRTESSSQLREPQPVDERPRHRTAVAEPVGEVGSAMEDDGRMPTQGTTHASSHVANEPRSVLASPKDSDHQHVAREKDSWRTAPQLDHSHHTQRSAHHHGSAGGNDIRSPPPQPLEAAYLPRGTAVKQEPAIPVDQQHGLQLQPQPTRFFSPPLSQWSREAITELYFRELEEFGEVADELSAAYWGGDTSPRRTQAVVDSTPSSTETGSSTKATPHLHHFSERHRLESNNSLVSNPGYTPPGNSSLASQPPHHTPTSGGSNTSIIRADSRPTTTTSTVAQGMPQPQSSLSSPGIGVFDDSWNSRASSNNYPRHSVEEQKHRSSSSYLGEGDEKHRGGHHPAPAKDRHRLSASSGFGPFEASGQSFESSGNLSHSQKSSESQWYAAEEEYGAGAHDNSNASVSRLTRERARRFADEEDYFRYSLECLAEAMRLEVLYQWAVRTPGSTAAAKDIRKRWGNTTANNRLRSLPDAAAVPVLAKEMTIRKKMVESETRFRALLREEFKSFSGVRYMAACSSGKPLPKKLAIDFSAAEEDARDELAIVELRMRRLLHSNLHAGLAVWEEHHQQQAMRSPINSPHTPARSGMGHPASLAAGSPRRLAPLENSPPRRTPRGDPSGDYGSSPAGSPSRRRNLPPLETSTTSPTYDRGGGRRVQNRPTAQQQRSRGFQP